MKLGSTIKLDECKGWVLDLIFQSEGRATLMIYTTLLKKFLYQTAKSNFYKTRSERRRAVNGRKGAELLAGGVVGRSIPKWWL